MPLANQTLPKQLLRRRLGWAARSAHGVLVNETAPNIPYGGASVGQSQVRRGEIENAARLARGVTMITNQTLPKRLSWRRLGHRVVKTKSNAPG